jgi:TetR/AcrR family transcriptional regulator
MHTYARLLSHSLPLFAARGYDAVGVQEIVEAAGVTKPTLYHYFGSKFGLLESLLNEQFSALFQAVEPASAYGGDITASLQKTAAAYFGFARDHPLFYRMHLSMWFGPPQGEAFKATACWNERQQDLLEKLFLQAANDHGNMRGRHRAYAATFLGMVNTYIGLALNRYIEIDDRLTQAAVHQFMHGIFS